jgi:hypothetical protein
VKQGTRHSSASRNAIADALRGVPKSQEHRRRISVSRTKPRFERDPSLRPWLEAWQQMDKEVLAWAERATDEVLRSRAAFLGEEPAEREAGFWYLSAKMTRRPGFGYYSFDAAAALLRGRGLNVVSPAEMSVLEDRLLSLASEDGSPDTGEDYLSCMARDLALCTLPSCNGAVLLAKWTDSHGALAETAVLRFLHKRLRYLDVHGVLHEVSLDDERVQRIGKA